MRIIVIIKKEENIFKKIKKEENGNDFQGINKCDFYRVILFYIHIELRRN